MARGEGFGFTLYLVAIYNQWQPSFRPPSHPVRLPEVSRFLQLEIRAPALSSSTSALLVQRLCSIPFTPPSFFLSASPCHFLLFPPCSTPASFAVFESHKGGSNSVSSCHFLYGPKVCVSVPPPTTHTRTQMNAGGMPLRQQDIL